MYTSSASASYSSPSSPSRYGRASSASGSGVGTSSLSGSRYSSSGLLPGGHRLDDRNDVPSSAFRRGDQRYSSSNGYDRMGSASSGYRSYGASSNGRPPPSPSYTSPYLTDIHTSSRYVNKRNTGGLMNGGSGIQSSSMNTYSSSSLPPRPSSQAKSSSIHSGSSSSSHQPQESSAYSSRPPKLSQRSMSLSPSRMDEVKFREALTPVRALIRDSFNDDVMSPTSSLVIGSGRGLSGSRSSSRSEESNNRLGVGDSLSRNVRLKSPSVGRERTRDDLIDSIVYTRTREHRAMPGFRDASDWEERRKMRIDCDKVYDGIILGNGDTIKNVDYLRGIGVTHVLNTAERHVPVNPAKYPLHGISYYGFHVDDHPSANVSRYFSRTTDFIDEAVQRKSGLVVVNCVMGWSRSATVVAAYLMMKKGMSSQEALETIRQSRPIRPNPGFLQQLADHENLLNKKLIW